MKSRINQPFDVSYNITFSGRTIGDGVPTTTTQMIRDKLLSLLEDCISKGFIRDYSISAELNNIDTANAVIKKSKKK